MDEETWAKVVAWAQQQIAQNGRLGIWDIRSHLGTEIIKRVEYQHRAANARCKTCEDDRDCWRCVP